VGGGAAGFFAAVACAEARPGARVTIFERAGAVLSKVKISGGGRCNVTHACFDPKRLVQAYPRGGQALLGPFHRFQPRDTVDWFQKRGVALKTEPDGRMFPVTDQSQTIIDCLTEAARAAGVDVRRDARLLSVAREGTGFVLALDAGERISCRRLLLATGSGRQGYQWAGDLGHTVVPPVPSLFSFQIADERLKGLAGISVQNGAALLAGTDLRQAGPLLITHGGLSGPAVLKLSAWGARALHAVNYKTELRVNWLGLHPEEVEAALRRQKTGHPRKTVGTGGPFDIPGRLWERLAQAADCAETRWGDLPKAALERLTRELTNGAYAVQGKYPFKDEFVTCGGVALEEVDFRTMESRKYPGLYFAGEILDVDGITGGYNFQNAWTTGYLAGRAMGEPGPP